MLHRPASLNSSSVLGSMFRDGHLALKEGPKYGALHFTLQDSSGPRLSHVVPTSNSQSVRLESIGRQECMSVQPVKVTTCSQVSGSTTQVRLALPV
jgi:hypothetical protein